MFELNKWLRIYQDLVSTAKLRELEGDVPQGATEKHHIVPKSMGGLDKPDNLVVLTLKEHFVCHHLLTRCVTGRFIYKMKHAYAQMVHCGKFTPTARQYEIARTFYAEGNRSLEWRKNQSIAATGKKKTPEQVAAMRARLTGRKLSDEHKRNIGAASKRRGMSEQCREARLKTLVKKYEITFPSGKKIIIENLKRYCLDNDIPYPPASSNSKTSKPAKRGILKGYNFVKVVDYMNQP